MMRVVWTKTARGSLVETTDFILHVWNEDVQNSFLNKLDYRIEQIKKNPELAPTYRKSEYRKNSNPQNHIAILHY